MNGRRRPRADAAPMSAPLGALIRGDTIAAIARRRVSPESQVSSTISTFFPRTSGGADPKTAGVSRTVSARYRRLTMIEWNGKSSIAEMTAAGTTPAVATPTTSSGSNSRETRRARARDSSPKSGQSTSNTSFAGRAGDFLGIGRPGWSSQVLPSEAMYWTLAGEPSVPPCLVGA